MARLDLFFLGSVRLELDGQPVVTDRRKAVALLAFLVVTGRPHSREALAALFWPETEQSRAYAYLRRTIWELNHVLGKGWLIVNRDSVQVVAGTQIWSDVHEFLELTENLSADDLPPADFERLSKGTALYRGDFLSGFTLRDCPDFDEWQFFQAEKLRHRLAETYLRLIAGQAKLGRYEDAAQFASRWISIDPLQEQAHRELMKYYALTGQRSAALRQYEVTVRTLEEELAVAPEAETTRLYQQIVDGQWPSSIEAETRAKSWSGQDDSLRAALHALPSELTPFVGRQEELLKTTRLLRDPTCRLLTLVGPGGSGKTRLATQVARLLAAQDSGHFADGAYFVPLASVSSSQSIVPAIAKVLGYTFHKNDVSTRQQLLDFLSRKRLLLLLDNFEHLINPQSLQLPLDILAQAPKVKILVTSRSRLNLQGEYVLSVPGLLIPDDAQTTLWQDLDEESQAYGALQLFTLSALRIVPDFALNEENLLAVNRICRLVDGLPLGIELAAGWMELLTPGKIAEEITKSLDFLETSLQGIPERQRSIRAIFLSSWSLLNEGEREAFQRLTVFRGGFDRQAAQAIFNISLSVLLQLANKSWLQSSPEGRFQVHELLRQYGNESLRSNETAWKEANRRHAHYFASFLENQGRIMRGPEQLSAWEAVESEFDNVRAAWLWLAEQGSVDILVRSMLPGLLYLAQARSMDEHLLPLVVKARHTIPAHATDTNSRQCLAALYTFEALLSVQSFSYPHPDPSKIVRAWELAKGFKTKEKPELWHFILLDLYGWIVDPSTAIEQMHNMIPRIRNRGRLWSLAFCYFSLARILDSTDQREEARRLFAKANSLWEKVGDDYQRSFALHRLGVSAWMSGQYDVAKSLVIQGRDILEALGNRAGVGYAYHELGEICLKTGDFKQAFDYFRRRRTIYEEIGQPRLTAEALHWESIQALRYSDLDHALETRLECLNLVGELNIEPAIAWSLWELGEVRRVAGEFDQAREKYRLARDRFEQSNDLLGIGFYHRGLGDIALAFDQLAEARHHFGEYLTLAAQLSNSWSVCYANHGLGRVDAGYGHQESSKGHFTTALRLAHKIGNWDLCMLPLSGLAAWLSAENRPEDAAVLSAFVLFDYLSWRETKSQAAAILDEQAARLNSESLERARERGQSMTLQDAIALWL